MKNTKKQPIKKLTKAELETNRKEFIRIAKEYFNEYGTELTLENGENLPKDETLKESDYKKTWSIDVFVLTKYGITTAYYRGNDKAFTVDMGGLFDVYLKDVELESYKFLQSINELKSKTKHLKIK